MLLYVAADGPREGNEKDKLLCEATRKVISKVDWKCTVRKDFSDVNLGLRKRMSSAISWLLVHEEAGIILEDDCIVDLSFFRFCEEILKKYKNDERVMSISGDNFQYGRKRTKYSYYFSGYAHCWGWATWRRAWKHYDDKMKLWPEIKKGNWLNDISGGEISALYWKRIFDLVYKNNIDSWAYRWQYSCWLQSGLTILPTVNLVTNIGFGKFATHTIVNDKSAFLKSRSLKFPLRHPPFIIKDMKADSITERNRFLTPLVIGGLIYRSFFRWHKESE